MESILVPVNLVSLAAAISSRSDALTPDSPSDDLLAIIRLTERLQGLLDRLAIEFEPAAINTVAA